MNYKVSIGASDRILKWSFSKEKHENSIDCIVTSPPYFQKRIYLPEGHPYSNLEIGREASPWEYYFHLSQVFREAKRRLKKSATVFVNIGDSFRHGCALRIPSGFIDMMQEEGYIFVQEIVWAKSISTDDGNIGSCKPESVSRRFTNSHEYVLLFVLDIENYYFDSRSVAVPLGGIHNPKPTLPAILKSMGASEHGQYEGTGLKDYSDHKAENPSEIKKRILNNKIRSNDFTARRRSVWQIPTPNSKGRHTAVGPERLFEICVLAGCPEGGTVLDPFMGEGTVGKVALENSRNFYGIELNEISGLDADLLLSIVRSKPKEEV
ncbi:DNA-methyltransferase [Leptospira adleri]|uniref:Methyltransferase n=1 Tax=Leptospira adleri TaxID=2023186 RepID=A0A2M9YIX5_9LEPT|nr:site-specific DNA-methyltransferase [Leptospira adleri]PJZ51499.1 site-specific DNA-methyltransferase [Leptospira adleri]PJZ61593.1 site-specific DNA-methyltransferase [Leptospira adleri]